MKSKGTKVIVFGAVLGALLGAASAFLLVKRAESVGQDPKLSPGEGIQVGLGVLGVLRLIAGFGKD